MRFTSNIAAKWIMLKKQLIKSLCIQNVAQEFAFQKHPCSCHKRVKNLRQVRCRSTVLPVKWSRLEDKSSGGLSAACYFSLRTFGTEDSAFVLQVSCSLFSQSLWQKFLQLKRVYRWVIWRGSYSFFNCPDDITKSWVFSRILFSLKNILIFCFLSHEFFIFENKALYWRSFV